MNTSASNKKKHTLTAILILLIIPLLFGCSKQNSQEQQLRWAVGAEPESLDPRKFQSITPSLIADQLFEGLYSTNSKGEVIPAAAEKCDISADGLTYTFTLRDNAKWSNGDPVTAQDFEYAWKSTLNPEFASEYAIIMYFLKNGEAYNTGKATADTVGVQAIDNKTLKVTLEKPIPFFLSLTTFHTYFPVNKNVDTANSKWATNANTFVSNGPFKMDTWEHNQKVTLSPNPHYWDKASVKLAKIDCALIDNGSTALSMFESKQLDISDIAPPETEMPRLVANGKLKTNPMLRTYYYEVNIQRKPLNDVRVRQALAIALDRAALLAESKKNGTTAEALAWIPFGMPDAAPNSEFRTIGGNYITEDLSKAKQLLAEAGFPDGKDFPEITILFPSNSAVAKVSAEAMQEMLRKNLNINVQLVNQEAKVFYSTLARGDFDLARTNWVGDYLDPMTFMDVFLTGSSNNDGKYSNANYDTVINQINHTTDQNKRMQLFHQAEALLMQDMPLIPIAFGNNVYLDNGKITGIIRDATGKCLLKNAGTK